MMWLFRKQMTSLPIAEAIERLSESLKKTENNEELLKISLKGRGINQAVG
jgi:transcription termination factor Rho